MLWTLLTPLVLSSVISPLGANAAPSAGPPACVAFDVNWNLLVFGFGGKDYNAGTQDTWTSSDAPTDITTSGRPPFNSVNTTCYLSQFTNAIYVLNADSANPTDISIYDATARSWSTQKVTQGQFDPTNFATILDHDTNVFYAYSDGSLYSLDMQLLKSAQSSPIPWNTVQSPDLSVTVDAPITAAQTPGANTQGYQPTIALAQNHVHFMGVPGAPQGSAKIFIIHFSFMQPAPQVYTPTPGFPTSHGKAASFFLDQGVQQEFAFIPDDGSATYVINVESNTTKTLTGPTVKDPFAQYYASTSALVQLTSDGKVAFLGYDPATTTSGGTWTTISKLPSVSFSSTGASGNSPLGSSGSGNSNGNSNGNNTGSSGNKGNNSTGAASPVMTMGLGVGSGLAGLWVGVAAGVLGWVVGL